MKTQRIITLLTSLMIMFMATGTVSADPSLVGHWKFDEGTGTTALDSSGNGNHGTLINNPTWTTGKYGQALEFDGIDDYVEMGNITAFDTSDFTFSFWFNRDDGTEANFVMGQRVNSTNEWYVRIEDTEFIRFAADATTENIIRIQSTTGQAIGVGVWDHYAIVVDRDSASNSRIFLNGAEVSGYSFQTVTTDTITNTGTFNIGAINTSLLCDGKLDDVRIYNRALTPSEIQDLYQGINDGLVAHYPFNGNANDESGNNNHGTVNGATLTNDRFGNVDSAYSFDGTDDYVSISGLLGTPTNITLSAWARLDAVDTNGAELISLGDYVAIRMDDSSGGTAGFYFDTTNNWRSVNTNVDYAGTGWHHFAYVVDDTNNSQKMYVDGIEKASSSWTDPIQYTTQGSNTEIGRHANGEGSYDFNGIIDDVRSPHLIFCIFTREQITLLTATSWTRRQTKI